MMLFCRDSEFSLLFLLAEAEWVMEYLAIVGLDYKLFLYEKAATATEFFF